MDTLLWLIMGGVVGWIASLIMGTDAQQGVILNIIVGVVGAYLAGVFLSPYFGTSTINQYNFSFPSLIVSVIGAVILIFVVSLLRSLAR